MLPQLLALKSPPSSCRSLSPKRAFRTPALRDFEAALSSVPSLEVPSTPSAAVRFVRLKPAKSLAQYRIVLRDLWKRAVSTAVACVEGHSGFKDVTALSSPDRPLTPPENELTRKAMLAGLAIEKLYAARVHPFGSPEDAKGGRYELMLNALTDFAWKQASTSAQADSPALTLYWLRFGIPGGSEETSVFRSFDSSGVSLNYVGDRVLAAIAPPRRKAANGILQFLYVGHRHACEKDYANSDTLLAFYSPGVRKIYPRKPFQLATSGLMKEEPFYAYAGQDTVVVSSNENRADDIRATSRSFPQTFVGPTLLASATSLIRTAQELTSTKTARSTIECAARLALYADNPTFALKRELRGLEAFEKNVGIVPESLTDLRFLRALALHLPESEDKNLALLTEMLRALDSI